MTYQWNTVTAMKYTNVASFFTDAVLCPSFNWGTVWPVIHLIVYYLLHTAFELSCSQELSATRTLARVWRVAYVKESNASQL